jgi:hypothetical protein
MRAGLIITIGNLLGDRQAFATNLGIHARKPGKLTWLRSLSQVGCPPQVLAAERLLLAALEGDAARAFWHNPCFTKADSGGSSVRE